MEASNHMIPWSLDKCHDDVMEKLLDLNKNAININNESIKLNNQQKNNIISRIKLICNTFYGSRFGVEEDEYEYGRKPRIYEIGGRDVFIPGQTTDAQQDRINEIIKILSKDEDILRAVGKSEEEIIEIIESAEQAEATRKGGVRSRSASKSRRYKSRRNKSRRNKSRRNKSRRNKSRRNKSRRNKKRQKKHKLKRK